VQRLEWGSDALLKKKRKNLPENRYDIPRGGMAKILNGGDRTPKSDVDADRPSSSIGGGGKPMKGEKNGTLRGPERTR